MNKREIIVGFVSGLMLFWSPAQYAQQYELDRELYYECRAPGTCDHTGLGPFSCRVLGPITPVVDTSLSRACSAILDGICNDGNSAILQGSGVAIYRSVAVDALGAKSPTSNADGPAIWTNPDWYFSSTCQWGTTNPYGEIRGVNPFAYERIRGCAPGTLYNKTLEKCAKPDLTCKADGIYNPCQPSNGNKFQTEVDFQLPGGFGVTRHYNSITPGNGQFGIGWSWQASKYIQVGIVKMVVWLADGRAELWGKDTSNDTWVGPAYTNHEIVETSSGYTLTRENGTVEEYNLAGQVLSETTAADQVSTYTYSNGQLVSVSNQFGHSISVAWDANGHISTITDPRGNDYTYSYDIEKNLTGVTYPDGSVRQYHYEDPDYVNHLTGITNEVGNRFATWSYAATGKADGGYHASIDDVNEQEKFEISYE